MIKRLFKGGVYESRTPGDLFREEVYGICLFEENLSGYKRFLFTVRTEPHKKNQFPMKL